MCVKTEVVGVKTEAYFVASVYDDLYKFDWPVLIERGAMCLWLDVSNVREHFGGLVEDAGRAVSEFEVVRVVGAQRADLEGRDFWFVRAQDLRNVKLPDALINANFELVLSQFMWTQLPHFLNAHIESLDMVSIFDIKDFWDQLKLLEHFKKYWLFRYKIVVMRYENEKRLRGVKCGEKKCDGGDGVGVKDGEVVGVDVKDGEKVLESHHTTVEPVVINVDAEGDAAEVSEKLLAVDLGITENDSSSTPQQLEYKNTNAQSTMDKNFIDTLNDTELKLITSLMENMEVQFKGLQEYDSAVRLHTTSAFLTLLRGTVGLLEHLLAWS